MILNNSQIYVLYELLIQLKKNENKLSIKTGFNILKNIQVLEPLYNIIAEARRQILLNYGQVSDDGNLLIPQEKIEEVNSQLMELSYITNEVNLNIFNLSDLEELSLSLADIEKLLPIINGEA